MFMLRGIDKYERDSTVIPKMSQKHPRKTISCKTCGSGTLCGTSLFANVSLLLFPFFLQHPGFSEVLCQSCNWSTCDMRRIQMRSHTRCHRTRYLSLIHSEEKPRTKKKKTRLRLVHVLTFETHIKFFRENLITSFQSPEFRVYLCCRKQEDWVFVLR